MASYFLQMQPVITVHVPTKGSGLCISGQNWTMPAIVFFFKMHKTLSVSIAILLYILANGHNIA